MQSITKEMLIERLEFLQKERQQLDDLIKIYAGAIQETNTWVKKLEEKKEDTNVAS